MEPLLYVMAILGCGEGDAPCEEIARAAGRYPTREACMAATEAELVRHGDRPFPLVVADCRRSDEAAQRLTGAEVLRPEPPPVTRN